MSATGIPAFDTTIQKTNVFLNQVAELLGGDRQRAYDATRAVLHALRDRLTVDECAHLAAQLPALLRGIYYEGWRPAGKPLADRSREAFLAAITASFRNVNPTDAARSVFQVLSGTVTAGEIEDVKRMLPEGVRQLWP